MRVGQRGGGGLSERDEKIKTNSGGTRCRRERCVCGGRGVGGSAGNERAGSGDRRRRCGAARTA